jgi:hypothetical protein
MGKRLSATMYSAIEDAHEKQLSPWDYGAATISALKKRGWIRPIDVLHTGIRQGVKYALTEAGENARLEMRESPEFGPDDPEAYIDDEPSGGPH